MGKKLTSLNLSVYISVITGTDENGLWFLSNLSHLSFGYVCLPKLENHFSCFASFSNFFFLSFSSADIYF